MAPRHNPSPHLIAQEYGIAFFSIKEKVKLLANHPSYLYYFLPYDSTDATHSDTSLRLILKMDIKK